MKQLLTIKFLLLLAGFAAQLAQAQNLPISGGDFEGSFNSVSGENPKVTGYVGDHWFHNFGFGDATVDYGLDTSNPHSGKQCQRVTCTDVRSGQMQTVHPLHIDKGGILSTSLWIRGEAGRHVIFSVTLGHSPYTGLQDAFITLTANWQHVVIRGFIPGADDYNILISSAEPGTYYVDDVTANLAVGSFQARPNRGPIPSTFLGMHDTGWIRGQIYNGDMEGAFDSLSLHGSQTGELADSWEDVSDTGTKAAYSRNTTSPHSGLACQHVSVSAISGYGFGLNNSVNLLAGKNYELTGWFKGRAGDVLDYVISNGDAPYNWYASARVALTSSWQKVTVQGVVGDAGHAQVLLHSSAPMDFDFDDVTLTEVGGKPVTGGITWPAGPVETLRLWDSDVTWKHLEPVKGHFNWEKLDKWVAEAQRRGVKQIILTLGQSPAWASSNREVYTYYGWGASAPPSDITDWKDYVRAVAQRYAGSIQAYEIWNEPNDPGFFSGTVTQLVELTNAASAILKSVDPKITVISPPAYSAYYLGQFLDAGGGEHVDVIGHHFYSTPPEQVGVLFANVRLVLDARSVTKPLWDTEAATGDTTTSPIDSANGLAKMYLLHLIYGIDQYNWYSWGQATAYFAATQQTGSLDPSPGGIAFRTIGVWLQGSDLLDAGVNNQGVYWVKVRSPKVGTGVIAWRAKGPIPYSFGDRPFVQYDLSGKVRFVPGSGATITDAPTFFVTTGPRPPKPI